MTEANFSDLKNQALIALYHLDRSRDQAGFAPSDIVKELRDPVAISFLARVLTTLREDGLVEDDSRLFSAAQKYRITMKGIAAAEALLEATRSDRQKFADRFYALRDDLLVQVSEAAQQAGGQVSLEDAATALSADAAARAAFLHMLSALTRDQFVEVTVDQGLLITEAGRAHLRTAKRRISPLPAKPPVVARRPTR